MVHFLSAVYTVGLIGFKPIWKPDDHASMFTSAEGWGLFTQKRSVAKQIEEIELRYGRMELKTLIFELPDNEKAASMSVYHAGNTIEATYTQKGLEVTVSFPERITLKAGQTITIRIQKT